VEVSDETAIRSGLRESADTLEAHRIEARAAAFSIVHPGYASAAKWPWRALRDHRRACALALAGVAWLPMVIGVALEGAQALARFAGEYGVHVRALVGIPVLILVGPLVDRRLRSGIREFVSSGLVSQGDLPTFERALGRMERLRDARFVLPGALALALVGSFLSATRSAAAPGPGWATEGAPGARSLMFAGWWYVAVSLALFQTLMWLWMWRWFIWATFLWRVSRLDLRLIATHSDKSAGLGFVGVATTSFAFVLMGPSAVVAASWIARMVNGHVPIARFSAPVAGLVVLILVLVLAPLMVFAGRLAAVRRETSERYGVLVQRYIRRFDRKWVGPAAPHDDDALGEMDAQNMADLGNVHEVILRTRTFPVAPQMLRDLAFALALPLLPMVLASSNPVEILKKIAHALV
jgi:hypothetical protein